MRIDNTKNSSVPIRRQVKQIDVDGSNQHRIVQTSKGSIHNCYINTVTLCMKLLRVIDDTRVVQKVLQMLDFHRYKRLFLAKFVMLE